jgi:hypothetical protein
MEAGHTSGRGQHYPPESPASLMSGLNHCVPSRRKVCSCVHFYLGLETPLAGHQHMRHAGHELRDGARLAISVEIIFNTQLSKD